MKNLLIFIGCILLITNNLGCRRKCYDPANPKCCNYDPCYKKIPNAGFKIRQGCWQEMYQKWAPHTPYVEFSDTIWGASADLLADFDSIPGIRYDWEFDGMSTIWHTKDLKSVNFSSYANNNSNYLPQWDSFYSKPLGVRLTVVSEPNECVGADTLYTQKRSITFAKEQAYRGIFKGTFSTNPTKEVEIIMNKLAYLGNPESRNIYVNFPQVENDTIFAKGLGGGNLVDNFVLRTYNQFIWKSDMTQPQDWDISQGITSMNFKGNWNVALSRYDVNFTYTYQKSATDASTEITFTGYQVRPLFIYFLP